MLTIPNNIRTISNVYCVDNTRKYVGAIHDTDISKDILQIYIYDIDTYYRVSDIKAIGYERSHRQIEAINKHIANNKFELILSHINNGVGSIITRNVEKLDPYKDIKKFELVKFTKRLSFAPISQKVIQSHIKQEHKRAAKQKDIEAIKNALNALTIDTIGDIDISRLKHQLGLS